MSTEAIIATAIAVALVATVVITATLWTRYHWNNGKCRECGDNWKAFDTDSLDHTGYQCGCGYHYWK